MTLSSGWVDIANCARLNNGEWIPVIKVLMSGNKLVSIRDLILYMMVQGTLI